MHIYRCATDEDDYVGFGVSGSSILMAVRESDNGDGKSETAELEFTGQQAHAIAAKVRELLDKHGKASEVSGLFLGRTVNEPGILISAGIDGGTCRSVILSRADAADLADRLSVAASGTEGASPESAEVFTGMARRAHALRITADVFNVDEVNLFDAAEWVAGENAEQAA